MRNKTVLLMSGLFLSGMLFSGAAEAAVGKGVPAIKDSKAYQQFLMRSPSELSKLIFLVDRFKESQVKIVYDDTPYEAAEAARHVMKFLSSNYKGEKAELWINKYATRSDPGRKLILARFKDGKVRKAKEVLLEELKDLEAAYQEDKGKGAGNAGKAK